MKILVITEAKSPSYEIVVQQYLLLLQMDTKVSFDVVTENQFDRLNQINFREYEAILFVRSRSLESLIIHQLILSLGIATIYIIDDYLLNIPIFSTDISNDTSLNIQLHLVLCTGIITTTHALSKSLGYEDKTFVIPNTVNTAKYLVKEPILHARLNAHPNSFSICITQSDALALDENEVVQLINALKFVTKKIKHVKYHFFGNCRAIISQLCPKNYLVYDMLDFDDFQIFLSNSLIHMALVPLTDSTDPSTQMFIRSKSNIKAINYGIAGVVGIYSGAYRQKMNDSDDYIFLNTNIKKEWADNMVRVSSDINYYSEFVHRGINNVVNHYDSENSKILFSNALQTIIGKKNVRTVASMNTMLKTILKGISIQQAALNFIKKNSARVALQLTH